MLIVTGKDDRVLRSVVVALERARHPVHRIGPREASERGRHEFIRNKEVAMWWECSECGALEERAGVPRRCDECGMAGVIFVPAAVEGEWAEPDVDSLRALWVRAGLERSKHRAIAR
jgi:hypothetical protein